MDIDFKFSTKQLFALHSLDEKGINAVLYGGAKGGGKTVLGCRWIFLKCIQAIKRFNLAPQQYPTALAYMGRKRGVDFNDTTLETWKKFIPNDLFRIRAQEKEIIILDRIKVVFGGFDDENNIKKFNSAEFAYYFIDQAEEVSQDDIGLLRGTLRLKMQDQEFDYKGLLSANPADCWLKPEFIDNPDTKYAFIQALPTDNPYLPKSYIPNLREAFKHRPELIEAYINGSWDLLAGHDIVIKPAWVREAVNKTLNINLTGLYEKVLISCDPARYGDDETVIYAIKNGEVIDEMIYGQKSTMETAGNCIRMKRKHKAQMIFVDSIGVGGGVVDRLEELGQPVYSVNFANAPTNDIKKLKYKNLRAEVYWEAGELFADGKVSIPQDLLRNQQLSHIKYKTGSRGRIQIESKEEIKKRLSGKSPDRADALAIGLWGLQFIQIPEYDFKRTDDALLAELRASEGNRGQLNPAYTDSLNQLQGEYPKSDYE